MKPSELLSKGRANISKEENWCPTGAGNWDGKDPNSRRTYCMLSSLWTAGGITSSFDMPKEYDRSVDFLGQAIKSMNLLPEQKFTPSNLVAVVNDGGKVSHDRILQIMDTATKLACDEEKANEQGE